MKYFILFLASFVSSYGNKFMQHLINPWYTTQDLDEKREIGNKIINLMHKHNYGKIGRDGIRYNDGGWSKAITLNLRQFDKINKPFNLKLKTIDGRVYNTKDHLGKIVFIDFFATFCSPCKINTNNLIKIKDKYGDEVSVLIISTDRNKNNIIQYQSQLKHKFATHFDSKGRNNKYSKEWGATLGTVYIINKDGTLHDIHGHKNIFNKVEKLIL